MSVADRLPALLERRLPIAVIGLGYVGLPLAVCLAKQFKVIGFDIDAIRVARLSNGIDDTREIDPAALRNANIVFTTDTVCLREAVFLIVAVPTPVDQAKRPDFSALISASISVGRNLRPDAIVVYESTVYPGATAEVCIPVIERESGLTAGSGFTYGYSPERINPGDKEHTIERICKVVSACDSTTLDVIAGVYGAVIPAGVYRAPSVEVAEAAKVIENTQRDLNIALVNELALIFHRMGIDTLEVLAAASTKWNFLAFRPGLVGGHCISVDPYYLTHKAVEVGYHPDVILAGRRINDGMGMYVANECIRLMINADRPVKGAVIVVLGLSFKENLSDIRNTRVIDIIEGLRRFGAQPVVVDPLVEPMAAEQEYGITLTSMDAIPPAQAVIIAVPHKCFSAISWSEMAVLLGAGAPILDIKGSINPSELAEFGLMPWRL